MRQGFSLFMKAKYFIILLVGLVLLGCSGEDKEKKALTFLVYMAADNSLTDYVFPDMSQMEMADFDPDQVNVLAQAALVASAHDSSCRQWQITPYDDYHE